MRKLLPALLLSFSFAGAGSGCIVHAHPPGKHKHAKKCHPSQYWDGHHCRHRGKGHGARKHDD
jgi:hypothetical protein